MDMELDSQRGETEKERQGEGFQRREWQKRNREIASESVF